MYLRLDDHSAELLDPGQIGHDPQALAADLLIIDLHNEIDQRMDELHLHHLVLRVGHQQFLIVEQDVGQTAQNSGDEFLH